MRRLILFPFFLFSLSFSFFCPLSSQTPQINDWPKPTTVSWPVSITFPLSPSFPHALPLPRPPLPPCIRCPLFPPRPLRTPPPPPPSHREPLHHRPAAGRPHPLRRRSLHPPSPRRRRVLLPLHPLLRLRGPSHGRHRLGRMRVLECVEAYWKAFEEEKVQRNIRRLHMIKRLPRRF